MSDNLSLNFEELLAQTDVADIPDRPKFVSLPTGVWKLKGVSTKLGETSSGKPRLGIIFKVRECVESDSPEADNVPADSLLYISISGEDAKDAMININDALKGITEGKANLAEVLESIPETDFVAAIRQTPNKQNPEMPFNNLVEIAYE